MALSLLKLAIELDHAASDLYVAMKATKTFRGPMAMANASLRLQAIDASQVREATLSASRDPSAYDSLQFAAAADALGRRLRLATSPDGWTPEEARANHRYFQSLQTGRGPSFTDYPYDDLIDALQRVVLVLVPEVAPRGLT